jgi:hypothetical protein
MNSLLKYFMLYFFAIFASQNCFAAPFLTIDAPNRVAAGSNFDVIVGISGLELKDLGAFSFNFTTSDKSLANIQYVRTKFGNQLGDADDITETLTDINPTLTPGFIGEKFEAFELSFLLDLSFQHKKFALLSIGLFAPRFSGTSNRILTVSASNFVLSDSFGNEFFTDTDYNRPVGSNIIVVPAPTTFALFALGLLAFMLASKNRERRKFYA